MFLILCCVKSKINLETSNKDTLNQTDYPSNIDFSNSKENISIRK